MHQVEQQPTMLRCMGPFVGTLEKCGRPWEAVAAICLGMAGVDTLQDQAALTLAIQDWFPQDVGMTFTSGVEAISKC